MVDVFAGVFDDDAFALGLVEGNHYSGKQGLFIDIAEWFLLALFVRAACVEIVGLVVEVIDKKAGSKWTTENGNSTPF